MGDEDELFQRKEEFHFPAEEAPESGVAAIFPARVPVARNLHFQPDEELTPRTPPP